MGRVYVAEAVRDSERAFGVRSCYDAVLHNHAGHDIKVLFSAVEKLICSVYTMLGLVSGTRSLIE